MEEVVTKEPAAVLQVRVTCLGSSSAGRDAGGGWADGFAREPKEKGEADSILSLLLPLGFKEPISRHLTDSRHTPKHTLTL
jgi:hypothetical protein